MDHDEAASQHAERDDDEPSAVWREAAELPAERKPINYKGTTEDILRDLGRDPDSDDYLSWADRYAGREDIRPIVQDHETPAGDEQIAAEDADWGDAQPSAVWLDLYARGLVRPPYRPGRKLAEAMSKWKPVDFNGTTEDLLRSIGRLPERDFTHTADVGYAGRVDLGGVQ